MDEVKILLKLEHCPLEPECGQYESYIYGSSCMHYVEPFCEVEDKAHLELCKRRIREIYLDE